MWRIEFKIGTEIKWVDFAFPGNALDFYGTMKDLGFNPLMFEIKSIAYDLEDRQNLRYDPKWRKK